MAWHAGFTGSEHNEPRQYDKVDTRTKKLAVYQTHILGEMRGAGWGNETATRLRSGGPLVLVFYSHKK